ncbi:MAG: aspartate aminotransferase family protein [Gemmatimonadales bacterium]|nr:aspartate aminotransferase family protein [Gemmatimonadales bacterium]MDQ3427587.1 aspartate aminotransferase family protein [Gemmatimonadota bacterium]
MSHPHPVESHVFYRKLTRQYPLISRGQGCYLYAADGRRYLDACGGAFVANLGHGVGEISEAMAAQAERLGYVNGTAFTHEPVEELASEIARLSPGDLSLVYPLCSGSEAVEAALKLARQYWAECGRPGKRKILALSPAYHGNTLLALSASARAHYTTWFGDWLVPVTRVPASYSYRCECRGRPPHCPACSGEAFEQALLREGPDTVAAVIAEPVGGSSTGATVPLPEYWRRIRAACDRHDVLLVADEVLTGAGRTGTWSALEPYGVVPDVMVLGKGIAGGYVPLSAVVAPPRLVDMLARGSGALLHAQTFSHHPTLCAAGVATLRYLRTHRLIKRCAEMGRVLHLRLERLRGLPLVGDIRGRGLLAGIEFVADRHTREPLPRAAGFAEAFTAAAMDAGLVVWPSVGHADGHNGDLVMLAPPFIITEDQIEEIVHLLERALRAATERIGAAR